MDEIAPACRRIGTFAFVAASGRNALRLPARISGRPLKPATYALLGRVRGRTVFSVHRRLIRADGVVRLRRAGTENRCTAGQTPTEAAFVSPTAAKHKHNVYTPPPQREAAPPNTGPTQQSPIVRTVTFGNAPSSIRPLLFGLLAAAIALLTTAALPNRLLPAGRVAMLVAERRIYFVAAGLWLLIVVAVVAAVA